MIIKNKDELATTVLRRAALDIIEAGIASVLPSNIMRSALIFDKTRSILKAGSDAYHIAGGRLFVIGGGKASGAMAENLEDILGPENITEGVVTCKGSHFRTRKIKTVAAGHPIPDRRGFDAVRNMLRLKEQYSIGSNDLVLCLISGGGSALMPYPAEGINIQDKQTVTELLLACGAEISEINMVRKHLSGVKGGRLGQFFAPAFVISLILSDVIGNDLSVIASGPTYPDSSTFGDAYDVLKKYDILTGVPVAVKKLLERGCRGLVPETPKALDNCHNYIIGDNTLALEAMAQKAEEMQLKPHIITSEQRGDTSKVARSRAEEIIRACKESFNVYLLGGETTPKLPDKAGKGGRNQHYAVASLLAMEGFDGGWVVAAVGTDGSDFLPEVAGAIVDNISSDILRRKNVDVQSYLNRYDSHTLLKKLGNAIIITGNTGTNVGDIIVYMLKR